MNGFSHPLALLLLLLLPALPLLRAMRLFQRPCVYAALASWPKAAKCYSTFGRRTLHALSNGAAAASYVCAVIAAAGPAAKEQVKVYQSVSSLIMFVLDTSPSMAAMDMGGGKAEALHSATKFPAQRLDAAKDAIREVAEKAGGAALGLTAFGTEAAVIVPPTADRAAFLQRLSDLVPGCMGDGTALGTALATAAYHSAEAGYADGQKCCVLVTDGENNAGFVTGETAAAILKEKGIALYVISVGKSGMSPIEYTDPNTGEVKRGMFESHFDGDALKSIALAGGGQYYCIEDAQSLTARIAEAFRSVNTTPNYYFRTETTDKREKPLLLALCFAAAAWLLKRGVLKEVL